MITFLKLWIIGVFFTRAFYLERQSDRVSDKLDALFMAVVVGMDMVALYGVMSL